MTTTQAPTDVELADSYENSEHERALSSLAHLHSYLDNAKRSKAKKR